MALSLPWINSLQTHPQPKKKSLRELSQLSKIKKVDQSVVDQVLADFSAAELSSWKFAYKDSQLVLYPVKAID